MYYRVFQKTLKMWHSKENYPKWLFIATYFSERTRTRTFRKNGGPGLTKRRTLSQNLLYQLKVYCDKFESTHFNYDNSF